ncbi:tetratricopeptide repeat protein [Lentzea alba]
MHSATTGSLINITPSQYPEWVILEVRLLGPLELVVSGRPVPLAGARQRTLLALLALNANRVVPLDQLVGELWENPPQSVRQQIHNAIAALRRALAGSEQVRIARTDAGYRLEAAEESIDLHRFQDLTRTAADAEAREDVPRAIELLRAALELWRGAALSGLSGSAIDATAASLTESRLTALEQLVSLRLRAGEHASLVSELTQLVAQHPVREPLRGSLMQALYLSGRQADALAVYEEGRKVLADELGIDPGAALRELHLSILNGSVTAPPERAEVARSDTRPSKSYLPHDTADFSGRSTELTELLEETGRQQPTTLVISAIDGMGGVGKTTLAIHLAHRIAESYPDGQYFVNLHGFSAGVEPITAKQALDQLLRDSGVLPELVPPGSEARSALWRSRLAGSRSLVLLDNAVDAAQVRPLLPGSAGSLVVVTSRRRLSALDGVTPMSLDVLSPQEAVDMFTKVVGERRAGQEPEAVAKAVHLCGYLPLAIRIAAARLRDRASWTVADLVSRIRDHAHRVRFLQVEDRNVMAVLKLSHRYLPPLQRKVFRLLSLNPGSQFDAYSAAALADLTVDQAESCLDALFDANLVKQNSPEQFHFHDLVRDCAWQLLGETETEQERQDAADRLLDFYLGAAETWCRLLYTVAQGRPLIERTSPHEIRPAASPAEATAALNAEFANLAAAIRFAAEHGRPGHAWRLVCALEPYLRQQNYGGQSRDLYAVAAEAANADGDVLAESICWRGLATVCREHGAMTEAIGHFDRALKLTRTLDDRNRECLLLIDLGVMHIDMDRYRDAEQNLHEARALIADDPDHPKHGVIANNLAVVCRELGRFDEALDHLHRSLQLETDANNKLLTRWNIGTVWHAQRRHAAAAVEFAEVLADSGTIGFEPGVALAEEGLCTTNRALGNFVDSLEHGRKALTAGRRLKMHRVECAALNALGETAFASGDLDHAEKVFVRARELAVQFSYIWHEARAVEGFAHVARARGHVAEAERLWREAVALHPAEWIESTYAQRHLAALADPRTTCFRCETRESPPDQRSR